MSKEFWIMCYEKAVDDLCEEHDIECDEAIAMLENILNENPHYLDNYMAPEVDDE
jgi:hypothetical protein